MDFVSNENKFLIGIDIGNLTSTISYFNINENTTNIIDISGGYGKLSTPTAICYSIFDDEFIFGEYARLQSSVDYIVIKDIVKALTSNVTYTIKSNKVSINYFLSKYIMFLLENVKNINPNGEIKGVVVSTDNYEKLKDNIYKAFEIAGISNLLVDIVEDNICILKAYQNEEKIFIEKEKILILDYANTKVKASIYQVENTKEGTCINAIKTIKSEQLSQTCIYDKCKSLLINKFKEHIKKVDIMKQDKENLDTFVMEQFDILFQRKLPKDTKIYYNFYYPPFAQTITKCEIDNIINEFNLGLNIFFDTLLKETNLPKHIILTGGGMEIDFIKEFTKNKLELPNDTKNKGKQIISNGASIICAEKLGYIKENKIYIKDLSKVQDNILISTQNGTKKYFLPIAYKGDNIYKNHIKQIIMPIEDIKNITINIYREKNGLHEHIKDIQLDLKEQFINRDIKTIRLCIYVEFDINSQMIFNVEDFGFGDIFKRTSYKECFDIKI